MHSVLVDVMTRSTAGTRDVLVLWLVAAVTIAMGYALAIALTGGFTVQVAGLRLRSHSWVRPALLASAGAVALAFAARARVVAMWVRVAPLVESDRFARGVAMTATASAVAAGIGFGTFTNGGSDSYGYVGQARLLARGHLTDTIPLTADFDWPDVAPTLTPLGFIAGRARGVIAPQYPPGLPLLLAPLAAVSERAIYLLVPVFGALLVWLTFRLGASLSDQTTGAMAAALVAASPTFLFQVVQPMSDVPAAACWLAALLVAGHGTSYAAVASGAIASVAILIRPNLAPLAGLIGTAAILAASKGRMRRALLFAVALTPGLVVLGWIQNVRYGSPLLSGYGPLSNAFSTRNIAPNLSRYPRWLTGTHTWFIWLSLAAPVWIVRRARQPAVAWFAVLLVAATWLAYLPYVYFQPHEWSYTRFLLPAVPVMLIFASAVAGWLLRFFPDSWRAPIRLVLLGGLVAMQLHTAVTYGAFAMRDQERKYSLAGAFVRDRLPATAFVLALQHSGSIRYYANRPTIRWDLLAPSHLDAVLATLRAHGHEPFLVVDSVEYEAFRKRFEAGDQKAVRQLSLLAVLGDARVFAFQ